MNMSRVTIIGGCGAIGSVASHTLAKSKVFDDVIIADINIKRAELMASQLGAIAKRVDVEDKSNLIEVISGSDVVVNCVGPFFKYAKIIMEAAIELGINYVDVNDDYDATVEVLKLHEKAKEKGVSAVIGLGASPGITNLLTKFCADTMLDETESVEYFHIHGGEEMEGPGVVGHRIHGMLMEVPVFIDGRMQSVRFFEDNGEQLSQEFDFPFLGKQTVYIYPHPEILTIPKYVKNIKKVLNKGSVLPEEYFQLTMDLVRTGIIEEEALDVRGVSVTPFDFTIAWILKKRKEILKRTEFGEVRGCISTVVSGIKDGKKLSFQFDLASSGGMGMGEGTGIPVAVGAIMMLQGMIREKGVLPPEACVDTMSFLGIVKQFLGITQLGVDGPLKMKSIDENGNETAITL